ncbi:heavy metal-binding domain-containing protein [Streptomyces sp. NPDC002886]|uniref:heavy metal-binding domain-containing protein n=1 Tax=Streptomyces sp. NPDC002886 TaxID=3364667 RepID=UPI003691F947
MAQRGDTGLPGTLDGAALRSRSGGSWDSSLSVQEFAAVEGAGFDPVGQVLGTAVFAIGYTGLWGCPGAWSVTDGVKKPSSAWTASYSQLVRTLYTARRLALSRAVTECRALGGDGIVGVDLRVTEFAAETLEFTALGTAVRARSRVRPREPFTSHLGGQDFARLVHSGWIPTALAFGIAIDTRHDDWRTSRLSRLTAGNQEVDGYTQLVGHVRHKAREQLAEEAARHGGDGVVVDDIGLRVRENECPSIGYARDVVAEAVLVGTAVARFGRSARPAGPGPLTIMRLKREH